MNPSRILATVTAVALASCGGETTAPEPTVASVTVTPSSGTLAGLGASVQFTALAKDGSGAVVTGTSATWASSDTGIATISAAGLATAVSPGNVAITATVQGVAGSAVLTVSDAGVPCANPTTVTLAAGGTQSYEGSACLLLPAGNSGDRYRVAVTRPAETGTSSDVVTATLKVMGVGVSQVPTPVGAMSRLADPAVALGAPSRAVIEKAIRVADATARFHVDLYEKERAVAMALISQAGGRRVVKGLSHRDGPLRSPELAAPQKRRFDISSGGCAVDPGAMRTGLLVYENSDLTFYQDSTQNSTSAVPRDLLVQLGDFFSSYGKEAAEDYFGSIPDIDDDGKLTVFITPAVQGQTAAYVSNLDSFSKESCASSNEADLVYFSLAQIKDLAEGQYQALGTLPHEAKHVTSLYNRAVAANITHIDQYQPSWIEEGTAEIASEMSSRYAWAATGGPAVGQRATRQSFEVTPNTFDFTAENFGIFVHVLRAGYLSSQPNGLVVVPDGASDLGTVYGSGWLFQRWLGDVFANAASAPKADALFFRLLSDSVASKGVTGIVGKTGVAFTDLFRDFTVSNSLHGTSAPAGSLAYTSYDFVGVGAFLCGSGNPVGDFPWPVTTTGTPRNCEAKISEVSNPSVTFKTANYTGPIGISGVRIHDFVSNGTGTGAQITLDTGGKPAKIIVVRVR